MKPIVLETKDGRASITKEDLIQIIQDSYDEGFKDGQREFFVPTYNIKCSDEELKELIEMQKNHPLQIMDGIKDIRTNRFNSKNQITINIEASIDWMEVCIALMKRYNITYDEVLNLIKSNADKCIKVDAK